MYTLNCLIHHHSFLTIPGLSCPSPGPSYSITIKFFLTASAHLRYVWHFFIIIPFLFFTIKPHPHHHPCAPFTITASSYCTISHTLFILVTSSYPPPLILRSQAPPPSSPPQCESSTPERTRRGPSGAVDAPQNITHEGTSGFKREVHTTAASVYLLFPYRMVVSWVAYIFSYLRYDGARLSFFSSSRSYVSFLSYFFLFKGFSWSLGFILTHFCLFVSEFFNNSWENTSIF